MATPKQQNSYPLRMDADLRAKVQAEADAHERTLHKEIILLLEEALEHRAQEGKQLPDLSSVHTGVLLHEVISRYGPNVKIELGPQPKQELADIVAVPKT